MTATLQGDSALLVLIDMQSRLADVMPRRDEVIGTSVLLARVAGILGIPVLVTRQYPQGLGETAPEIREVTAEAQVVDKVHFACSAEPAFRQRIEASGKRQIVLAGMETHICVLQTALALHAEGYDVHVAADATCSRRQADYLIALERLRFAGVIVTGSESVIYEALGQAATPEFRAVLEVVKSRPVG